LAWTIDYAKSARDQLRKLDKTVARRIIDYMDQRIAPLENPRSVGKALSGPLGELWRYRVGDYRIICDIRDKKLVILVLQLGNRREIYR
jgi:mRNA interferase RelE/StbE